MRMVHLLLCQLRHLLPLHHLQPHFVLLGGLPESQGKTSLGEYFRGGLTRFCVWGFLVSHLFFAIVHGCATLCVSNCSFSRRSFAQSMSMQNQLVLVLIPPLGVLVENSNRGE